MFRNILVAYDGSEHSRKAASIAGELAQEHKSEVTLWIVTVMDRSPWELGEPYLSQYIEEHTREGEKFIKEAMILIGDGIDIHSELLFGSPAESILQVAETRKCDLIVMGARGLNLLKELLLGSQAQKVINNAVCPVLVIK